MKMQEITNQAKQFTITQLKYKLSTSLFYAHIRKLRFIKPEYNTQLLLGLDFCFLSKHHIFSG